MNWEKFEDAGHARNPFPLTSILSRGEEEPFGSVTERMSVGGSLVPMHARSGRRLPITGRLVAGTRAIHRFHFFARVYGRIRGRCSYTELINSNLTQY